MHDHLVNSHNASDSPYEEKLVTDHFLGLKD